MSMIDTQKFHTVRGAAEYPLSEPSRDVVEVSADGCFVPHVEWEKFAEFIRPLSAKPILGAPTAWTFTPDGFIALWPCPNARYEVELTRGVDRLAMGEAEILAQG